MEIELVRPYHDPGGGGVGGNHGVYILKILTKGIVHELSFKASLTNIHIVLILFSDINPIINKICDVIKQNESELAKMIIRYSQ